MSWTTAHAIDYIGGYVADTKEDDREVTCSNCEIREEVHGTYNYDAETFAWQCARCGYFNEQHSSVTPHEPDPDYNR